MAIEQQQDDSPEGLRRKRLRELVAQQEQDMASNVPERGVEEISPRKSAISTLKEAGMPGAAKLADDLLPNEPDDLSSLVTALPVGKTMKLAYTLIPDVVKKKLIQQWNAMPGVTREKLNREKWMEGQADKEMEIKGTPGKSENVGSKAYQAAPFKQAKEQERMKGQEEFRKRLEAKKNQPQAPVKAEAPAVPKNVDQKEFLDSLVNMGGAESGQQYNKQKALKKKGY